MHYADLASVTSLIYDNKRPLGDKSTNYRTNTRVRGVCVSNSIAAYVNVFAGRRLGRHDTCHKLISVNYLFDIVVPATLRQPITCRHIYVTLFHEYSNGYVRARDMTIYLYYRGQ